MATASCDQSIHSLAGAGYRVDEKRRAKQDAVEAGEREIASAEASIRAAQDRIAAAKERVVVPTADLESAERAHGDRVAVLKQAVAEASEAEARTGRVALSQ